MAEPDKVSDDAANFLMIMTDEVDLPVDWDTSGLWKSAAQDLAQFLADYRRSISLENAAMLTGMGGMIVEMAKREMEALTAAGRFFRGQGGGR